MIITVPHTTTDYTYFDAGGVTFAVPFESTSYTSYVQGGVCDGEDIYTCQEHLKTIEKKRLLDTVGTLETCGIAGFVWDTIDKYPQIPSYRKPHCEPIYKSTCNVQYDGQEPISAICKWDTQDLTPIGRYQLIKRILERGRHV